MLRAESAGDASAPGQASPLALLCLQYGLSPPAAGQGHFFGDFGRFRLKWEGHGEFDDYTVYRDLVRADAPFDEPAISALPEGWLDGLPGRLITATHVVVVGDTAEWSVRERIASALGAVDIVGAEISEGTGTAYTDFQLDARGFTRFLLVNRAMSASQCGRQAQRLIEIETYRMMAMLGFPVARQAAHALNDVDRRLGELIGQLETAPPDKEPEMLREVTRLAAITERIAAEAGFRIAASRAYHALVEQRGRDLREQRIPGLQTLLEFLERRFGPAMAFCESVDRRISASSEPAGAQRDEPAGPPPASPATDRRRFLGCSDHLLCSGPVRLSLQRPGDRRAADQRRIGDGSLSHPGRGPGRLGRAPHSPCDRAPDCKRPV
jgi:uncharacterized membrane-anchored protein